MTDDKISQLFGSWAVVKTDNGFDVQRVPFSALSGGNVLAAHPNEASARKALERMEMGLPIFIKHFEASIAHEIELRNKLIAAYQELAKPRPEEDDPGAPPNASK